MGKRRWKNLSFCIQMFEKDPKFFIYTRKQTPEMCYQAIAHNPDNCELPIG